MSIYRSKHIATIETMLKKHSYSLFHASAGSFLTLSILVGFPITLKGFKSAWEFFVYGSRDPMTPASLLNSMLSSVVVFSFILLILWGLGKFLPPRVEYEQQPKGEISTCKTAGWKAILLPAIKFAPLLTVIAFALNFLGGHIITWLTQKEPYDQLLVTCFTNGAYSLGLRASLILMVLFQAPLLEEPIFRGVIFRGFARTFSVRTAMILSGAIFALVHFHAASFVALWFLGASFAWLYQRTGSILTPITAHFIFNGINLVLLFLFPDLASHS